MLKVTDMLAGAKGCASKLRQGQIYSFNYKQNYTNEDKNTSDSLRNQLRTKSVLIYLCFSVLCRTFMFWFIKYPKAAKIAALFEKK